MAVIRPDLADHRSAESIVPSKSWSCCVLGQWALGIVHCAEMNNSPSPFSDPPGSNLPDKPLCVKCNYNARCSNLSFRSARNCTYDLLQGKVLPSLLDQMVSHTKTTYPRLGIASGWRCPSRYDGRTTKEIGIELKMKSRSLMLSTSSSPAKRHPSLHQILPSQQAAPGSLYLSKYVLIVTAPVSPRPPQ